MSDLLEQLTKIHTQVFNRFTYETDLEQYHVDEKWVMPPDTYDGNSKIVGDCEDFALACRKLCRDAGLQTRLIYCEVAREGGHCVLECEGWILDNRFVGVKTRDYLESVQEYQWKRISGYNTGDSWSFL